MNNKGFTLVEVLAVVVIIGIIGGIAIPAVLTTMNNGKQASYEIMVKDILIASETLYQEVEYSGNLKDKDNKNIQITGNEIQTDLATLISNGFLNGSYMEEENADSEKKIINPKSKEDISECKIKINKSINSNSGAVNYTVISVDNTIPSCPTTADYEKEENNDKINK